jgi:hypothetical protein
MGSPYYQPPERAKIVLEVRVKSSKEGGAEFGVS